MSILDLPSYKWMRWITHYVDNTMENECLNLWYTEIINQSANRKNCLNQKQTSEKYKYRLRDYKI